MNFRKFLLAAAIAALATSQAFAATLPEVEGWTCGPLRETQLDAISGIRESGSNASTGLRTAPSSSPYGWRALGRSSGNRPQKSAKAEKRRAARARRKSPSRDATRCWRAVPSSA